MRKKAKVPKIETLQSINITELPVEILKYLLRFLNVSSLESLGLTCSIFRNLVLEDNITTLGFPFSPQFVSKLGLSKMVEKKSVLRLRSSKTNDSIIPDDEDVFVEYLVTSQLALLDLSNLRELNVLPPKLELQTTSQASQSRLSSFIMLDRILLYHVSLSGCLRFITRLDILVDYNCYLHEYIEQLPNLLHLGLAVHGLKSLDIFSFHTFLCRLEFIVAVCRAPDLHIEILTERRRNVKKVFVNQYVKQLSVCLPCNFNLHLVMENVQEVKVTHPESTCTYYKSPAMDRQLHRSGLCGVHISSVYHRCPNIISFAGVIIGHVSMKQTFTRWNNKVKKIFYQDYVTKGGTQEFKSWCKARGAGRWFIKQEVIPDKIGLEREQF